MAEELDREALLRLLAALGGENDAEVAAAAREIDRMVSEAGLEWDELLADPSDDEEWEDVVEGEAYDDEEDEDDGDVEPEAARTASDDEDDALRELTAEEARDARALIQKIMARQISADTREEMEEYLSDLEADELAPMDLRYLKAMNDRLAGG